MSGRRVKSEDYIDKVLEMNKGEVKMNSGVGTHNKGKYLCRKPKSVGGGEEGSSHQQRARIIWTVHLCSLSVSVGLSVCLTVSRSLARSISFSLKEKKSSKKVKRGGTREKKIWVKRIACQSMPY